MGDASLGVAIVMCTSITSTVAAGHNSTYPYPACRNCLGYPSNNDEQRNITEWIIILRWNMHGSIKTE